MADARIVEGGSFPPIQGRMANGKLYNSSMFLGKKRFYSFFRYTGCPACGLYYNSFELKKDELKNYNIALIAIFEVEPDILVEVLAKEGREVWEVCIADPEGKLYEKCGVERSVLKLGLGVLDKRYGEAMRTKETVGGGAPGKEHMKDASGRKDRMPAQFLIDEKNKVYRAYYSKNITDRLPLKEVLQFAAGVK